MISFVLVVIGCMGWLWIMGVEILDVELNSNPEHALNHGNIHAVLILDVMSYLSKLIIMQIAQTKLFPHFRHLATSPLSVQATSLSS